MEKDPIFYVKTQNNRVTWSGKLYSPKFGPFRRCQVCDHKVAKHEIQWDREILTLGSHKCLRPPPSMNLGEEDWTIECNTRIPLLPPVAHPSTSDWAPAALLNWGCNEGQGVSRIAPNDWKPNQKVYTLCDLAAKVILTKIITNRVIGRQSTLKNLLVNTFVPRISNLIWDLGILFPALGAVDSRSRCRFCGKRISQANQMQFHIRDKHRVELRYE